MYVCLCNGLTDRQIRAAIEQGGARTPAQVFRQLGCAPRCGKCLPFIAAMARRTEGEAESEESALACAR